MTRLNEAFSKHSLSAVDDAVLRPLLLNSEHIVMAYPCKYVFKARDGVLSTSYDCVTLTLDNGTELHVKADSLDELKMQLALKGQKLD